MCVTIPAHGDLAAWEAAASASLTLDAAERLLVGSIAHQVRRAMIVDGARPGDLVHIAYADLAQVS